MLTDLLLRSIARRRGLKPHTASLHVFPDEKNWRPALLGALSFEHFSGGVFELHVHDGGGHPEDRREAIRAAAPGANLVSDSPSPDLASRTRAAFAVSSKAHVILWSPGALCVARPRAILESASAAREGAAFSSPSGDPACVFVPSAAAIGSPPPALLEPAVGITSPARRLRLAVKILPALPARWLAENHAIQSLRKKSRELCVTVLRRIFLQIPRLVPEQPRLPAADGISVHVLIGVRSYREVVVTLRSFERFTGRRWQFILHDDGTLTAAEFAYLRSHLTSARFITRARADAEMLPALHAHPECRALRGRLPHSLKFFDFRHFAPHDRIIVLDADVLFFKRPAALLALVDQPDHGCWFNAETPEAYCLKRRELEPFLGGPLWHHVNSGVALVEKSALSLDLVEDFLRHFQHRWEHPGLVEQTAFALCASRHGRGGPLPPEYEITSRPWRSRGAVMRHYAAAAKFDLMYLEGVVSLLPRLLRAR